MSITITPHLSPVRVVTVHRLTFHHSDGRVEYMIRGEYVPADDSADVAVVAGPITGSWWEVPLPPCPDCGGDLVWYEAGYVPGARRCMGQPIEMHDGAPTYDATGGCGSMYTVAAEG